MVESWIFLEFLWLNRYLCTYKLFLEKIKSKLRGSYSSNLTCFQLNRRKFVFFTRGGSKLFTPNHLVNCALNMPSILEKLFGPILQQLFGRFFTKKPPFGHSENGKWFFRPKKMKTSLGHKIDHLAWKPLISTRDSSFLRTLF